MDKARQAERLNKLRDELRRRELDGFIIPRSDEHQGEYVPPRAERLAWLTEFTGSAGMAVVLLDRAALFVDGRYTIQATNETDTTLYEHRHLNDEPATEWVAKALPSGGKLGYDPWLHTPDNAARFEQACALAGGMLVPTTGNPLDAVWEDQPAPPTAPVVPQPLEFTGETSAAKRRRISDALRDSRQDACVLTAPESLAWLLNIRGGDVPFTPLPLGFAVVHADESVDLFMDGRKFGEETRKHLNEAPGVRLHGPEGLEPALKGLDGKTVRYDALSCAVWIVEHLKAVGATPVRGDDPCALPRACKNEVELNGTRAAHQRDGVALTRFLAWVPGAAEKGGLTEMEAADRLEGLRREDNRFMGPSFATISGSGPHGAIVHYRVTAESDRTIGANELFLVDSGAQYLDGTTDVTRTVLIGESSDEIRRRYTQVLKGHVALATVRFPVGTTGSQLDVLARFNLWADGVDYDHGTGHGVGSYLSVHEGPQRISKVASGVALKPGMILSNEPGYYKTGAFGIRIENLVVVREVADPPPGAERKLLEFETLTLAPFDRRLIDTDMLTAEERVWVDGYHARVLAEIGPKVDEATRAWMEDACAPL